MSGIQNERFAAILLAISAILRLFNLGGGLPDEYACHITQTVANFIFDTENSDGIHYYLISFIGRKITKSSVLIDAGIISLLLSIGYFSSQ
ncbi:hypothetical protein BIY29_14010 [Brenneria alni]|uniref:Uncharacterized protein n=1 Tax=Brenneria alni TaxID=71656 RepID=A0A421DLL1_9GAMM|nr:hypothetical protein BIY29_14010 [Brenneria alni]